MMAAEAIRAILRNPAFARQAALLGASSFVASGAAYAVSGLAAGAWALASGVASLALFAAFSTGRYREIARLAAEMDEVLHDGRHAGFSACREGDVEVLRSQAAKMAARLARTADQLACEKAALAQALADVSHQIRTPLTAASLELSAIERAKDARERAARVRALDDMMGRISWLIASLLKIAKLDAGAIRFDKRPVDAAAVIRRALRPLEAACDLRGIELVVHAQKDAEFLGDEAWSAEAVGNIVKNCMEHTPAGGRIDLEAREDALACRIVVKDTGCGIDACDLPHIFERFYRGGRAEAHAGVSETTPQGFGIGLALAQSLISAQGGAIRAANREGGGARFEVAFPKMTV